MSPECIRRLQRPFPAVLPFPGSVAEWLCSGLQIRGRRFDSGPSLQLFSMPKLKPGISRPTPEEDAAIDAGIAADPDNPEWTAQDFAEVRPASEALPPEMYAVFLKGK